MKKITLANLDIDNIVEHVVNEKEMLHYLILTLIC